MGLAIAVFVPEGIVIISDGIAEIKNSELDNGFLQRKQRTMFLYKDKYIVCTHGDGYSEGLPYAYYMEKFSHMIKLNSFASTKEFATMFTQFVLENIKENDKLMFYIAGIDDYETDIPASVIYLVDRNNIIPINKGYDNNNVFNYHSIGHNLWVNKLLLPTIFNDNNGDIIPFDSVEIDFSKYSIEEAIDFSKEMIRLSHSLNYYAQIKELIGTSLYIGVLETFNGNVKITSTDLL